MTMRGSLLGLAAVAVLLCPGLFVAVQADDYRVVSLPFRNLPAGAAGKVVVKAIKVQDGTVVARVREEARDDLVIDVEAPKTNLVVTGAYLSLTPAAFLQGAAGIHSDGDPVMTMTNAATASTPNSGSVPTYPPAHGKAIGYNREQFTASGPGAPSWLGRGLADVVVTDLVAKQCGGGGDGAYVVVGTADPRDMALVQQEVNLQNTPGFDPAYRVTPRFTRPTHMVKGQIVVSGRSATVNLTLEDMTGAVVATVSRSGSDDDLFDTMDGATTALAREACREPSWKGTVTITQARSRHGVAPGGGPSTDELSVSVTCTLTGSTEEATCNVSARTSGSGNGAFIKEEAAGSVKAMLTVEVTSNATVVSVPRLQVPGTVTTDLGGGATTFDLGPWRAEGPRAGDDKRVSGSWSRQVPPELLKMYDSFKETIAWDLSRQ